MHTKGIYSMDNILVFQQRPGIGDMCLFLSSIHEIAKNNKDKNLILLTKERTRSKNFLQDDKLINKIIYIEEIFNKKYFNFFKLFIFIKKLNPKKIFIFHYDLKLFLLFKILGVKKIYTYGFFKKKDNISKKAIQTTCQWLNIEKYNTNSKITYNGASELNNKILIGIASSGPTKRWGTDNFINLIKKIDPQNSYNIIILAGKNDEEMSKKIINELSKKNIISTHQLSIYDTLKYIKNAILYVGSDTGFMHLSSALGVKTFGLFGDTPTNYADYSDLITPIIPEGFDYITHDSLAMKHIKPDYVYLKIKNYLKLQ